VLGPGAEVPALRLVDDLGREHQHLAVVLVSNNPYTLDRPLTPGARPALDSGRLGIIVLDAPSAAPHPPRTAPHTPGRAWSAPRLDVSALPPVHAGIDGEAIDLSPPLQFTIRPRALRVRISLRDRGMPPSAPLSPPRRTGPLPER
jgi:diacylglycerol kinase family enzyme